MSGYYLYTDNGSECDMGWVAYVILITFFHAQRNLSYLVFLLLVRSGMSLFMAVEETGSLMGVDIQSVADDVLEKWMEVVCSVAEMRPLLRLSAYRSGLFYEGKQWRCSIPQACLVFLSREMTFS